MGVEEARSLYNRLMAEVGRVVVGKEEVITLLTVALLAGGHVLLEGVPGVAKTLIAKAFARALSLKFTRIQFTPDLLPADVMGTFIFNQQLQDFTFRPGPVFTHILLADEINRASPKTQSALLEAMQELQVTVEGYTKPLEQPFMVLASENPVEHEGTYPLPEAQLDRFMFRVVVDYPTHDEGVRILSAVLEGADVEDIRGVVSREEVLQASAAVKTGVEATEEVMGYIVSLVEATRSTGDNVLLGGSPRATVHLFEAARAYAAIQGRSYTTPDDVKFLAYPVLNHRILLRPDYLVEARLDALYHHVEARRIVQRVLEAVEPPR